tara:strand:+ start:1902 stop:2450 length:549 start_codon:yes stop_codon:yes gene_type:complete
MMMMMTKVIIILAGTKNPPPPLLTKSASPSFERRTRTTRRGQNRLLRNRRRRRLHHHLCVYVSVNLKGKKNMMRKRKREKGQKRAQTRSKFSLADRECVPPNTSSLFSAFLQLSFEQKKTRGLKISVLNNKTVGIYRLSRRQKFFVQKALSRISAVSVVVSLKTRHRRNARAGKEGCGENKE